MKKPIFTLLSLLAITLLIKTGNASNCLITNGNYKNLNLASGIVQQQSPRHDTTSYWVISNGYYIAFTKDTVPNQWVYKSSTLAANIKTPDPAKKIAGATVTAAGAVLRIAIGNKIYLFRNMQSTNTLHYVTSVTNNGTPAPNNAGNK